MKWMLFLTLLISRMAIASDWTTLSFPSDDPSIEVDQSSLVSKTITDASGRNQVPVKLVWFKMTSAKPIKNVAQTLEYAEFSCEKDTYWLRSVIEYDSSGGVVSSSSAPELIPSDPIAPDTILSLVESWACDPEGTLKRLSYEHEAEAFFAKSSSTSVEPPSAATSASEPQPRSASKGNLPVTPDTRLTPGDVLTVNRDQVCAPGYAHSVRHVSSSVKHRVYAEYGISDHKSGAFEIDHLISLELGGSNDIKNLWPESYDTTPWNAHLKDVLENKLHSLVCSGQLPLRDAQQMIGKDWITAYKKYVTGAPAGSSASPAD